MSKLFARCFHGSKTFLIPQKFLPLQHPALKMTTPLNNEKRYETNLPFKGNHPVLYDHLCKNRLEQRFKKFKKNKEFQTFAENRVQEINDSRGCRGWYYHNTKSNQADLSTRIQNFSDFVIVIYGGQVQIF